MFENQLLTYTVKEAASEHFLKVPPETVTIEVIEKMLFENFQEVLVVDYSRDRERLLGILTLTDVSHLKKQRRDLKLPISTYMNPHVITIDSTQTITTAKEILISYNIGRLPIYEKHKVVGIIRFDDIISHHLLSMRVINNQYVHIMDSMHEAITVTDRKGNVLFWNKNAEEIYHITAEEILYKPLKEFFPDALSLSVLEEKVAIKNAYHSPKPGYNIIISALPVFIDGEFLGVVSTEKNVTEYTNLLNQLDSASSQLDLLKEEIDKMTKDFFSLGHVQGKNPVMQNLMQVAKKSSRTDANILITGESGTGKEVFAKSIHQNSERKGLFVPVNCSAIPSALFESEFFGYSGGAFTGALKNGKAGYCEMAHKGTLFLDEIGDLPLEHQGKLLRVLQEGTVNRIGSNKIIEIDTRIIAATNKNLSEMIEAGLFREDLFYRLNVVQLDLPPLRERREDIVLLFTQFLNEVCSKNNIPVPTVGSDVYNILLKYRWKGNIRELKNAVEYMVVVSNGSKITKDHIPQYIILDLSKNVDYIDLPNLTQGETGLEENLSVLERNLLIDAMKQAGGNKSKAAKILKIPRSTLYYKLEQHKIPVS
jgi:PAS domain S-box-containing protein